MHHCDMCFTSQVFTRIFTTRVVRSAEELFAIEKMAAQGHRQQEDHRGAWSAAVDNEAVVAEAPLGWRDGVAQR